MKKMVFLIVILSAIRLTATEPVRKLGGSVTYLNQMISEDLSVYRDCDLIVHDCETSNFKTGIHAHYEDLKNLPEDIRKKMLLVHYGDEIMEPNGNVSGSFLAQAFRGGFKPVSSGDWEYAAGFVNRGTVIDTDSFNLG